MSLYLLVNQDQVHINFTLKMHFIPSYNPERIILKPFRLSVYLKNNCTYRDKSQHMRPLTFQSSTKWCATLKCCIVDGYGYDFQKYKWISYCLTEDNKAHYLTILRRYSLIYNQSYLSLNELTKHKGVYFILADSVLLWFYLEKQQKSLKHNLESGKSTNKTPGHLGNQHI